MDDLINLIRLRSRWCGCAVFGSERCYHLSESRMRFLFSKMESSAESMPFARPRAAITCRRKKNRRGLREGRGMPARWQGTGYVGTGGIVVGDRDGYRAAPGGNCQELRGEIKAAPVFRQPIVGSRDTVPATVLFIRNGRRMEEGFAA